MNSRTTLLTDAKLLWKRYLDQENQKVLFGQLWIFLIWFTMTSAAEQDFGILASIEFYFWAFILWAIRFFNLIDPPSAVAIGVWAIIHGLLTIWL